MALTVLEDLLKASMGLSSTSIGPATIERAVQERRVICGLPDLDAYLERVRTSGAELQALIEAVVVPETWFFRDPHAFAALARLAREVWLPIHPTGVLSLLSLPCSTGEEPYSMAMALVDTGIPASRFRVDAVDISARNLTLGVRAVYGKNSFRGHELGFRDRHFDVTAEGYRVNDAIRQQVRFQQGNLFSADLLPGTGLYDAIFCRNVLIYFDRPAQDRVLVVLNRLLHPQGTLFVAPAETGLPGSHDLVSTKEPLAFAFRKTSARLPPAKPAAPILRQAPAVRFPMVGAGPLVQASRVPPVTPSPKGIRAPATGAFPAKPTVAQPKDPATDLDEAVRLADEGRFAEAATRCEQHLRRYGPSATGFYLLGLVRDATGSPSEAASFYRKALYLDPNHHDTQIHLALLMEKQGDAAGAQVLRNRARRLEERGKAPHE